MQGLDTGLELHLLIACAWIAERAVVEDALEAIAPNGHYAKADATPTRRGQARAVRVDVERVVVELFQWRGSTLEVAQVSCCSESRKPPSRGSVRARDSRLARLATARR